MSRRLERRARTPQPADKPLKTFFIPHGEWDADLLQQPYGEADKMLTDNPGKRVAVFTENISGVDRVARSATEAVLHGESALDALVRAEYRRFSSQNRIKAGVDEAQFTALYKEGVKDNPFTSKITEGIDQLNAKHPGRVLWIGEGMDEDTARQLDNEELRQNYFGVPLLTASGTVSAEDFAETKIGEMRKVGALHRNRDDKLKKDVHSAIRRKDVVGGVLWRGSFHQHVGQELRDEGFNVEITTDNGVDGVALYSPDKQLFRELMADPTRPISGEEFDIVIHGAMRYDGWDQRWLHRINSQVEKQKAELGIETLGQRELIVVNNAKERERSKREEIKRKIVPDAVVSDSPQQLRVQTGEVHAVIDPEPQVGDTAQTSIEAQEAEHTGTVVFKNDRKKTK